MAPTTSRPWPPPSTADRARRSVGERLPRLSTSCCDPVRLVLRRPIESGLDPSVTVMDQAGFRPAPLQGHDQRVHAQPGPEVVGHAPADDLARGRVLERGQVQPALVGRQVAEILSAKSLQGDKPTRRYALWLSLSGYKSYFRPVWRHDASRFPAKVMLRRLRQQYLA